LFLPDALPIWLARALGDWDSLVGLHERHLAVTAVGSPKRDIYLALAKVWENELQDPHRDIDAYENALGLSEENHTRDPLAALARLYKRVENWSRAVDVLARLAQLAGDR